MALRSTTVVHRVAALDTRVLRAYRPPPLKKNRQTYCIDISIQRNILNRYRNWLIYIYILDRFDDKFPRRRKKSRLEERVIKLGQLVLTNRLTLMDLSHCPFDRIYVVDWI